MASADSVLLAYDGSESAQAAIQQAANLFSDRPLLVLSVARSVAATGSASIAGLPADVAGEAISRLNEEALSDRRRNSRTKAPWLPTPPVWMQPPSESCQTEPSGAPSSE